MSEPIIRRLGVMEEQLYQSMTPAELASTPIRCKR